METESDGAARHNERALKRYRRLICGEESKFRGIWLVSRDGGGGCAAVAAGDDDNIIRSPSQIQSLVLRALRETKPQL